MFLALITACFTQTLAKVYFQEEFTALLEKSWVHSSSPNIRHSANFIQSPGWWYPDVADTGILTDKNNRQYAISAKFPEFSPQGKPLVVQYMLRLHQNPECGGSYIKLLPAGIDQQNFDSTSPFVLMFGPDICEGMQKLHILLPYQGQHLSLTQELLFPNDTLTHQLTLVVNPDFGVEYLLDNEILFAGNLKADQSEVVIEADRYEVPDIAGVGIEILQITPGALFDNIFICDSKEEALEFSGRTFMEKRKKEPSALSKFTESQEKIREDYNREHVKRFDLQKEFEKKMGPNLKVGEKVFF